MRCAASVAVNVCALTKGTSTVVAGWVPKSPNDHNALSYSTLELALALALTLSLSLGVLRSRDVDSQSVRCLRL